MSHQRRNFIVRKEDFVCHHCGQLNPVGQVIPNHCRYCLYSKHVDQDVPGDRASLCGGLMPPIGLDYDSKKGYMLRHRCQSCGKEIRNKVSPEDNQELIIQLSRQPHV